MTEAEIRDSLEAHRLELEGLLPVVVDKNLQFVISGVRAAISALGAAIEELPASEA